MMQKIIDSLQRITSSTKFIPEIDGLRFVAIMSVVLYHINGFIIVKNQHIYLHCNYQDAITNVLSRGHLGVELFFVISGFILSYPFASHYLNRTPIPNIKQYFIRRLTRLEPPYIITMTVLFVALVVMNKHTFADLLPHLLASLLYVHNIVYPGTQPLINSVAWSLEIEIQFYIVAPLLVNIFRLSTPKRRFLIILSIVFFTLIQDAIHASIPNIFNYLQYFAIGFLLSDLKLSNTRFSILSKRPFCIFLGIVAFCSIWMLDTQDRNYTIFVKNLFQILLVISIFVFYYLVLFSATWKRLFSVPVFTIIGGMCYSIYLIHYPIISMFGNPLLNKLAIADCYLLDFIAYNVILTVVVIVLSTVFFKLIEQVCMRKDWHVDLLKKLKCAFLGKKA